jgi:hypothetical protein
MIHRIALIVPLVSLVAWTAVVAVAHDDEPARPRPCEMRVESELFADASTTPIARSLTLFQEGVAWDFLEPIASGSAAATEIVLHDPARERVLVIDPQRHLKTQVELLRLERLSVSLSKWARSSEDRLVRWAGGPDFSTGLTDDGDRLELVGPRVKYAVTHEPAPSRDAAEAHRRFADTAILLKALLQPGGIPPFPRLAINERLAAAGAIPVEVRLEIDPRLAVIGARPERLRCVHRLHPRLLTGDLARIEDAKGHVAAAESVPLAAFVQRHRPDDRSTAATP